LFFVDVLTL